MLGGTIALSNTEKGGFQGTITLPGQESLIEREIDVLIVQCMELATAEIADKLHLSPRTMEGYRKSLLEKTGAKKNGWLGAVCREGGFGGVRGT